MPWSTLEGVIIKEYRRPYRRFVDVPYSRVCPGICSSAGGEEYVSFWLVSQSCAKPPSRLVCFARCWPPLTLPDLPARHSLGGPWPGLLGYSSRASQLSGSGKAVGWVCDMRLQQAPRCAAALAAVCCWSSKRLNWPPFGYLRDRGFGFIAYLLLKIVFKW